MLNRSKIIFGCINLFLLLSSLPAKAHPFVIVSAAPPQREAYMPPMGYASCYTVPPAFYEGVWINAHRICQYDRASGGAMWVSGYWQCVRFRHVEGVCLDWGWMPSHWASPHVAEYGVRWGGYYESNNRHHYSYNHDDYHSHHHEDYNGGYQSSGSRWY